jgi:hypothetical protein
MIIELGKVSEMTRNTITPWFTDDIHHLEVM